MVCIQKEMKTRKPLKQKKPTQTMKTPQPLQFLRSNYLYKEFLF